MLLFKGALVSLLLPVWALAGVAAVAVASYSISVTEDPEAEQRVLDLGLGFGSTTSAEVGAGAGAGPDETTTTELVLSVILVAGLVVHVVAAVATSRAVAAMAGSIGGLLGTAIAGIAAFALAVSPSGGRTDGLQVLTQPVAVVAVGALSLVLGFRAYLAHVGRWRYARQHHNDDWGNDWYDGGDGGD